MDTTLEDRKIKLPHIIAYGVTTELIPIIANLLYVYGYGNLINSEANISFTEEYMDKIGIFIFMSVGFLSYMGTAFWIARRKSRSRTMYNGVRLLLVGIIVELLFFWIVGVDYQIRYVFSFLVYFVGIVLAAVTPPILKGKETHRKDWDAQKDREYHEKKRK